jgi:hypothetical protein
VMHLRRVLVVGSSFAAADACFNSCSSAVISCFLHKLEKRTWGGLASRTTLKHHFLFSPAANSTESSCRVAAFVVNSEPITGTRPSVRVCVGLISYVFLIHFQGIAALQVRCRKVRSVCHLYGPPPF